MGKLLRNLVISGLVPVVIGSAVLGGVKALDKLDDIRLDHSSSLSFDLDRVTNDAQFDTQQLFVPSNPRINQNYETNGHAYVFVHTGYFRNGYFRNRTEDEYEKYLDNVNQLIKELNDSDALVLYLTEPIPRPHSRKLLELLDNPFVIVTEYLSPHFKRRVKTENGIEEQSDDLVYSFLRDNGVNEVRFIGEMVWWENGLACLGTAAESFYKQGFKISGVEGGVFPTTTSDNLWLDTRGKVESFYDALGLHRGIANSEVMGRIYTDPIVLKKS